MTEKITILQESDPGAMLPLDTLPVFFRAAGRRVMLVGGSEGAAWKAELIAAAAARVDVYAPAPCARLESLAAANPQIALHRRDWAPQDLRDAMFAVIDAANEAEARAFRDAACETGIAVNVIDRPEFCDFQFGSIVNRSPLVIGISTGGAAPVFGQALRARIETLIPAGLAAWARAAREWRKDITARDLPFRARRRFWEMFADRALARPDAPPGEDDARVLVENALSEGTVRAAGKGRALLVGAGPGNPELITLRAVRALQSADVVLYDDLASPALLDLARREAEKIDVGKRGRRASPGQPAISALLVDLAGAGKTVVRLKGGDPMIFGRATEEIEALLAAGIDIEIVPGVTAASGAAASLLTSLTERDLARRVQFVTAHGRDGRLPEDLDWNALADPGATTAVYMGAGVISAFCARLAAAGLPATTAAIAVERATCADERIVISTIGALATQTDPAPMQSPCMLLVGAALAQAACRLDKRSAASQP